MERLIQLVRECRVRLENIPLAPICEDYWQYLQETCCSQIDSASLGMYGLAYLVERKAWGMLPSEEEVEDLEPCPVIEPTAGIYASAVRALLEAKEYRERLFFRQPTSADGQYELPFDLSSISSEHLVRALRRLLEKASEDLNGSLAVLRVSMAELTKSIHALVREHGEVDFEMLLPQNYTRLDVVWHFLAILESARLGFCLVTVREDRIWLLRPAKT